MRRADPPASHVSHLTRACVVAVAACLLMATPAWARNPRNPYSSFNLSGINYGSMRWEQAQRQGKRVWPYYNTPTRTTSRGPAISGGYIGGGQAGVISQGSSSRRIFRRR
jgi:hypothetical protein